MLGRIDTWGIPMCLFGAYIFRILQENKVMIGLGGVISNLSNRGPAEMQMILNSDKGAEILFVLLAIGALGSLLIDFYQSDSPKTA